MNVLEPEKLEWMKDLPAPRKKGTKKVGGHFKNKEKGLILATQCDFFSKSSSEFKPDEGIKSEMSQHLFLFFIFLNAF